MAITFNGILMRKDNLIKNTLLSFSFIFSHTLGAVVLIERCCNIPDFDSASTYCEESESEIPGILSAAYSTKEGIKKAASQSSAPNADSSGMNKSKKLYREAYCAELTRNKDILERQRTQVESSLINEHSPKRASAPLLPTPDYPLHPPGFFMPVSGGFQSFFWPVPPVYPGGYGVYPQQLVHTYYPPAGQTLNTGGQTPGSSTDATALAKELDHLNTAIESLSLTLAQECEETDEDDGAVKASGKASQPEEIPLDMHVQRKGQRTTICSHYLRGSLCPAKERCLFSHNLTQLRRDNPKYKTQACKNDCKTRQCSYGIKCHFLHRGEIDLIREILEREKGRYY